MGLIHIMERGGDDYRDYKKAVKAAKEAIDIICELTEDMEDKYSERGSYRMRSGMSRRDDSEDMMERRYRR
jgi:hypothetical protein